MAGLFLLSDIAAATAFAINCSLIVFAVCIALITAGWLSRFSGENTGDAAAPMYEDGCPVYVACAPGINSCCVVYLGCTGPGTGCTGAGAV